MPTPEQSFNAMPKIIDGSAEAIKRSNQPYELPSGSNIPEGHIGLVGDAVDSATLGADDLLPLPEYTRGLYPRPTNDAYIRK